MTLVKHIVHIPPQLDEFYNHLAECTGRPLSAVLRDVLTAWRIRTQARVVVMRDDEREEDY